MPFTADNAKHLLQMMQLGHLGEKTYEAFLVLSGRQRMASDIPQEAIDNLIKLGLGIIETPTFMFSREGGELKNEEPTPVFILTQKGKKVAKLIS